MIVQLSQTNDAYWRANIKELPGSPPVGQGKTTEEALCLLFIAILCDVEWKRYIDFSKLTIEKVGPNAF